MLSRWSHVKLACFVLLGAWLTNATSSQAAPLSCDPIDDPRGVLLSNDVVLLGELHGTREIPRFVASAACLALSRGRSVTVALEIPREENARLQTYLASQGRTEDLDALLEGQFWRSPCKDGRSSEAMRDLLETLRGWRATGAPVRVIGIDPVQLPMSKVIAAAPATGESRDHAMADSLAASIRALPTDLFLVLTGNLHSRLRPGASWDPRYEPMGYLLSLALAGSKRLVALDVRYPGGKAFVCTELNGSSTCKPTDLPDKLQGSLMRGSAGSAPGVYLKNEFEEYPYSGYFYFTSPLTASQPAVSQDARAAATDSRHTVTASP